MEPELIGVNLERIHIIVSSQSISFLTSFSCVGCFAQAKIIQKLMCFNTGFFVTNTENDVSILLLPSSWRFCYCRALAWLLVCRFMHVLVLDSLTQSLPCCALASESVHTFTDLATKVAPNTSRDTNMQFAQAHEMLQLAP